MGPHELGALSAFATPTRGWPHEHKYH